MLVEKLVELQRLAKIHPDLPEALLQRADDLEDVEDRFLLLRCTAQLPQIGAAFEHSLVADVHRHEEDRQARGAQIAAQGDGEHAGLGLQHASGTRATALDEVFHRKSTAEQGVQVLVEHRGIERVALERTAHEEGAATTQQAADHRHVEVDARSDVRRRQAVAEQQIGKQQVVDMTAVARHVDDFVALHRLLQRLQVIDADAVVDLVPEPGQHHLEKAHGRVGVVRGDLVAVAQRPRFGLFQRNAFALGLVPDCLTHLRAVYQAFDQVATVRQVGADHRRFLIAEMHPQHAMNHAQGALVALVLRHQLIELDRRRELHAGFAPEHDDTEQLAQPSGDGPAVGEQQFPGTGFAIRRATPEHADRDDLGIVYGVLFQGTDEAHQWCWRNSAGPGAEPAGGRVEKDECSRLDMIAHRHVRHRARQTGLAALVIEHREIAQ